MPLHPRYFAGLLSAVLFFIAGCASTSPAQGPCNERVVWGSYLQDDRNATIAEITEVVTRTGVVLSAEQKTTLRRELKPVVKWRLIRFMLLDGGNHNYGALPLKRVVTANGEPVVVYRTGITSRPDKKGSCFKHLLEDGGTRHVVNLYSGDMPTGDLEASEAKAASASDATYFMVRGRPALSEWRHQLKEHPDDPEVSKQAQTAVATLINTQILRPNQSLPKGNVHVHCGGGMHRTGMVLGILDRCLNGASPERVEATLKKHTAFKSDEHPGGYERGNLAFILGFDCGLLTP